MFLPPPPPRPPRSLNPLPLKAGKIEIIDQPGNKPDKNEDENQIYVLIYSLIIVAAVMYIFYCIRDKGKFE